MNPDENERIDLWSGGDGWFYTGGAFYCPTHDCNLEDPSSKLFPWDIKNNCIELNFLSVLTDEDPSQVKCFHCLNGDCSTQDEDDTKFGNSITCPVGMNYCAIERDRAGKFTRACLATNLTNLVDTQLQGDILMNLGWCFEEENQRVCFCAGDNCNTGFHGVKCHKYQMNNCHMNDENYDDELLGYVIGGETTCLTGIDTCSLTTIDYQGMCQIRNYDCGFNKPAGMSNGCESLDTLPGNVLATAEVCYCDALEGKDKCNPYIEKHAFLPRNSASTLYSIYYLVVLAINA